MKFLSHSKTVGLNGVFCVLLAGLAIEGHAATFVFITNPSLELGNQELNAIGATSGYQTPGYTFFLPSPNAPPASIHGTAVMFYNFAPSGGQETTLNTAVFSILGDLNLSATDRILGLGTNFLRLEVMGDVSMPAGSRISVEAFGPVPGAGGGRGVPSVTTFTSAPPTLRVIDKTGGSGGGTKQPGVDGTKGSSPRSSSFPTYFEPVQGSAGGAPRRGLTSPGAGGTHSFFSVPWQAVGGNGGVGGEAGLDEIWVGVRPRPASNGGGGGQGATGEKGPDGRAGNPGESATSIAFPVDSGGLYGGAGGGSGEQGGVGYPGANGGGGGGG